MDAAVGTEEVYVAPNNGSRVVVLEDTVDDGQPRNEQPVPAPRLAPPPRRPPLQSDPLQSDPPRSGHRDPPVVKSMLPAEDLLQFADLAALANPDKVAPPAPKKKQDEQPAEDDEPDRPVPAKFPPAPKRRTQVPPPPPSGGPGPSRRKPSTQSTGPTALTARPPAPKRSSRKPAHPLERPCRVSRPPLTTRPHPHPVEPEEHRQPHPWSSPYEVESGDTTMVFTTGGGGGDTGYYQNPYEEMRPAPAPVQRPRPARKSRHSERRKPAPPAPSVPTAPKVPPEELRRRREEDERKEKMQLLHMLHRYGERGHKFSNDDGYSMENDVEELRFEVSRIRKDISAKHSVKWYKVFLMILVSSVEALNTRFDPFGIQLKGWSRDMNEKKEDLDDCFHRLHDKYSAQATIEPEWELAFAFFGGGLMYHLESAAKNHDELGNIISAISGGGGSRNKPARHPKTGEPMSPPAGTGGTRASVQAWTMPPANAQNTGRQQPQIMTNMPVFQQPVQQFQQPPPPPSQYYPPQPKQPKQPKQPSQPAPRIGRSGRRIMSGPALPGGAIGMDVMSAMAGSREVEEDPSDIPIDFNLPPPRVGGPQVATSSPKTPAPRASPSAPSRKPAGRPPRPTRTSRKPSAPKIEGSGIRL